MELVEADYGFRQRPVCGLKMSSFGTFDDCAARSGASFCSLLQPLLMWVAAAGVACGAGLDYKVSDRIAYQQELERPVAGFVSISFGDLLLAKNGLFLLADSADAPLVIVDGPTINDVHTRGSTLIAATDSGLFSINLASGVFTPAKVPGYNRSVRDLLPISDRESVLATQDGLRLYDGSSLRTLGPNVEVSRLLGMIDEGGVVVGLTEPDRKRGEQSYGVIFATGEFADYIESPSPIEDGILFEDKVLVSTVDALYCVDRHQGFRRLRSGLTYKLLVFGSNLWCVTDDGLFRISFNIALDPTFVAVSDGSFTSLASTGGTACAFGEEGQVVFDGDGKVIGKATYSAGLRCNRGREIGGTHFYCTEAGVFSFSVSEAGEFVSSFARSPVESYDVVKHGGHFLLSTSDGVRELVASNIWLSPWKVIVALAAAVLVILSLALSRMPRIFLSYRRSDSEVFVGCIHDNLCRIAWPFRNRVIFDKSSFSKGKDFRKEMRSLIGKCDVFVPCIGADWLGGSGDGGGHSRIEESDDPVRVEVEIALELGKPILPILLLDSKMPKVEQMPEPLRPIIFLNACRIRDYPDFPAHFREFVRAAREIMREACSEVNPPQTVCAWIQKIVSR